MTKEQINEFTLRTSSANHSGLVVILFDIVHVYTEDALKNYDLNDINAYIRNLELSKRALNELMSCFSPTAHPGGNVLSVLRFIYGKMVSSVVKREPQELARCLKMLDSLREAFAKLSEKDKEGPVMKNTHQVYAGLTYGKNTLNESVMNSSNRGFKA